MREAASVGVVGLGLMGASFAIALKTRQPSLRVVGIDTDDATVAKARDLHVLDAVGSDLELVRGSDVVMVAVPIRESQRVFIELAQIIDPQATAISDLASVKVEVVKAAQDAGIALVGGHPLCGSEASGIDAADPSMFAGATWVLTEPCAVVEELIRAVGAEPILMDAATHDRCVARVSHAAFVVSAAYVNAAAASETWPLAADLAGPGFRDMSRLAAGSTALYADISAANRDNLVEALDEVVGALTGLRQELASADAGFVRRLQDAKRVRGSWLARRSDSSP